MAYNFKEDYLKWLHDNISECEVGKNIYRITFPFLDRNNDCTEIYIKVEDGKYTLTDDGETLDELELSNFNLFASQKRTDIFNHILMAHGVKKSDQNELYIECYEDDLPQMKHLLTQCMIKVSDLFYTARGTVQSLFIEDVQSYLDRKDIRYSQDISFRGLSGLDTNYDFVIPKSRKAPERIIKVVNNIDQLQTNSILFLWQDTSQARKNPSTLYVFLQDTGKKIPSSVLTSMIKYGVVPVQWSKRNDYIKELAS